MLRSRCASWAAIGIAFGLLSGCGASTSSAPAPKAAEPTPEVTVADAAPIEADGESAEEAVAREMPRKCANPDSDVCAPPPDFSKRLCDGTYPEVALSMFKKSTPWTRGYVGRNVEAWYLGGKHAEPMELRHGEEVLVVAHRSGPAGGMQVSGASGGYDVLRWDGRCVSLMGDEIMLRRPAMARHATIPWKYLDEEFRDALRSEGRIEKLGVQRTKACRRGSANINAKRCEQVESQLSLSIVQYVRNGGSLPDPQNLP